MKAMLLDAPGSPLRPATVPVPKPGPGELLIRVGACGVCRTDLHIVDGDLPGPERPVIPGHEIVGTVEGRGGRCRLFKVGDRVGVPWLGRTCAACRFCRTGRENLCERAEFTGYHLDGGYAEYVIADERYCFSIPKGFSDAEAAPLLCAGLIGYRSYRQAGDAPRLGLYGFGAAAHIVAQLAVQEGRKVYAFTRPGDSKAQEFARSLGAVWAGDSDAFPPERLDAAILYAPVGPLVPAALAAVDKGGTVVCAGIHMSDIPSFPYRLLWGERSVRSTANLTRQDGAAFFKALSKLKVRTQSKVFPLSGANEALGALRSGSIEGAAVLEP